nr:MAG TPA: hypothetical protein [Caudoviricetes sp.]
MKTIKKYNKQEQTLFPELGRICKGRKFSDRADDR